MKYLVKYLFLGVISISLFSCVGNPIDKEKSTLYCRNWGSVYYTNKPNTFVIHGHKIKGADAKTFVPLAEEVAMDKNTVYYKTFPQPQVDRASFQVKEDGTMRDKNHIYIPSSSEGEGSQLRILYRVDLETYGSYKGHKTWAYDKDHVYLGYSRPVDVDRATFSFISDYFMKDKDYVYAFIFGELRKMKMNADSIVSLSDRYIRDNKQIYFFDTEYSNDFMSIPFENVNNIKLLADPYIIVDNKMYNRGILIEGVDVSSFEILDNHYSKDKLHVYYDNKIIPSAELASFELLQDDIAKDSRSVYSAGKKIDKVDSPTFRIINPIYAVDKNHVYVLFNEDFDIIEGADPSTFTWNQKKGISYGVDKKNEYYNGRLIIKN